MTSRLEVGACTHAGHVRRFNEDAYVVTPTSVTVADGMGGHSGGDVASRIVVDELGSLTAPSSVAETRDEVAAALARAHGRIREYGERQPEHVHAGSTAVTACLVPGGDSEMWLVANVGDSRAYVLREGVLTQVTRDHSVVAALLAAGMITADEEADHPERHVLLRAVSGLDAGAPEFFEVPDARGARLLLCSDGVCGLLSEEELTALLAVGSPRTAADGVVAAALAAGGTDNATAVVVDVM